MNTATATIKLYDILVEKGVDKNVAREALDEFVTREEAKQTLATKDDIARLEKEIIALGGNLRSELYRALLIHGFVTVATLGGLWKLFG